MRSKQQRKNERETIARKKLIAQYIWGLDCLKKWKRQSR